MNKTMLFFLLLLAVTTAVIAFALTRPTPIPLSPRGQHFPQTKPSQSRMVLGFLPHWNVKKLSDLQQDSITHIAYFSLKIDGAGNILKKTTSVSEEPGYTVYKRLDITSFRVPYILVFSQSDADVIDELLSSETSINNAVQNILALSQNAAGINIDLEPPGIITGAQRQAFVNFVKHLSLTAKQTNPSLQISVDVYPTAASKPRLWDLALLEPYVDYFVVMTYDYYRAASDTSGPNSPLRSTSRPTEENILKNLREVTAAVPPSKILLGIPFYGYEWTTIDTSPYSSTLATGKVASLARIDELIKEKSLQPQWNTDALTPYLVLQENEKIAQIHYENETSLNLKLQLVKQAGLGGIAIWALGYESPDSSLWELIRSSLLVP